MRALFAGLLLAGCTMTTAGAPLRLCRFSYAPSGDHVAYFAWETGGAIAAVACSMNCEPVLRFSARTPLGYRWADTNRLEFADPGASGERLLTRIRSLSVYAVPAARFAEGGGRLARLHPRSCTVAERVVLDEDAGPEL